jgi:hypothetical protein
MITISNDRTAPDFSAFKRRQQATLAHGDLAASRATRQASNKKHHKTRAHGALALRMAAALASTAMAWLLFSAVVSLSVPRRSQLMAATAGRQLAVQQQLSSGTCPQTWPQTSRNSTEYGLASSPRWAASGRSIKLCGRTATSRNVEQPIADARASLGDWR